MKKIVFYILIFVLCTSLCGARDFMVEFVEENYKQTAKAYSNDPYIYHSIQVTSPAGPKLLILTGDNLEYRKWLRHYIASNKRLIARVPDAENDRFIASKAYEIDVANIHPVNGEKWISDIPLSGDIAVMTGNLHILVLDANEKRSQLISTVISNMGYTPIVSENGAEAVKIFRIQPEKFLMIIANHEIKGMTAQAFVEYILKVDHEIPILVETGYKNQRTKIQFETEFSKAGSVLVKPVALEDLQNTITNLVKKKG